MSNVVNEINFVNFGLNSDDSLKYITIGSAPEHYNVLVAEDNNNGVLSNLKGNKHIQLPTTIQLNHSYVYITIGSYYNELTRSVYYFIFSLPYDSDGSGEYLYDNYLLRLNEDDETIDLIFHDTKNYFGLHKDYLMRDCRMLGTWLYFNPKISEPKMIDVDMAYNYSNYTAWSTYEEYVYGDKVTYCGGLFYAIGVTTFGESPVTDPTLWGRIGDSYQDETSLNFDSEFHYAFNVIKMTPVSKPSIAYDTDDEIQSNNVRGKTFRFAYRYKYFDGTYSVYSDYSNISLPVDDEEWNGEITGDTTSNNFIKVDISLHSPALIKEADIIFQEIGSGWKRCKIINRREQVILAIDPPNFTYNFYNNEAYETITPELVPKVYDSVPRTAQTTEIINKNILCYGQCLEGFDNLNKDEIDVSLTPEIVAIDTVYDVGVTLRNNVVNVATDFTTEVIWDGEENDYYTILDIGDYLAWGVGENDAYRIIVDGTEGIVTFGAADVLGTDALAAVIRPIILGSFIWTEYTAGSGLIRIGSNMGDYPQVTVSLFYTPTITATTLTKAKGFKTGANHPFCIFYYDENLRRWDAQTSKESIHGVGYEMLGTTVYVPMFNQVSSPAIDTACRWVIDWEIGHLPPIGAKYWRWGYASNSLCSYFVQYIIQDITNPSDIDDTTAVNITPLQTLKTTDTATWNQFPHSNIDEYHWLKGDRIRFLTVSTNPAVPTTILGDIIDGIIDYEIISQSTDLLTIYTQEFDYAAEGIGVNTLVEIYRPIKIDSKQQFYEFGSLLPIIKDVDGYSVHGGIDQNQEYLTNIVATGRFDYGDVYHILRTPSKPLNNTTTTVGDYHESMWWSDFYDSDDWSKGKLGEETSFNERELNIIRYSHQYLQDTQINGLSTFDGIRYKELNDTYGEIMGMEEVGDTLKVYQEKKPSSVQLGRIERSDETGKISVSLSSDVLGSIRYSTTRWGTEFRESIIKNNRFVYGFDIYNGVMWRDSANGIFPISGRYADVEGDKDYKMSTYFKNKAKALLVSGVDYVDVLTAWDEEFDLLYVTFHDYVNTDNNGTIVFHEPSNRWICFAEHDCTQEYNSMLELDYSIVRGFDGGIGYSFNDEDRFAYFNIVTSDSVFLFFECSDLEIRPIDPSIISSSQYDADLLELEIEPRTPTPFVSYVNADDTTLDFLSTEGGFSSAKIVTMSITPDAYIDEIPDWVKVADIAGDWYDGDSIILDTYELYIYPVQINLTSTEKTGNVVLKTDYGDTCTIVITQDANIVVPNVTVAINPSDSSGMTITNGSGYNTDGTIHVYITFTPDHPSYGHGDSMEVIWSATKNGTFAGIGTITVLNELLNVNIHLTLSVTAYITDAINIYLGEGSFVIT